MTDRTSPPEFNADDIVDSVREPLLILDGDFRVLRANRAFYQAFHVAPDSTELSLVYDLGNGQWNIPALRELLEKILPAHQEFNGFEVEHEFPTIGRKVMMLSARRLRRDGHHTEAIVLAMEDITERRRIEDERRELETRFTSLVKNIRDHSIFTLSPDGQITSWNQEAERILGYSEQEALGQHFSIIFSEEDRQAGIPAEEMRTALTEGRAEDERWHERKNGEKFWAFGIVTPSYDTAGKHTGYSKILRDMTDRKQAEEAMLEVDRRKDEFIALLAHELRNPLSAILFAVHLLPAADIANEAVQSASATIERQVDQLVRLVEDLLDMSRINRGQLQLRTERFNLATAIERAIESSRSICEAKDHEFTVTLPTQPTYVNGDLARLAQIISNLLNNACKFTDPGGHIWLTVECHGNEVVIRVRDNGAGVASEQLPRLFQLFTQLDSTLDRSYGGMGIGLSLVKKVAELHGGTVEAHSAGLGQGSEFIVRLPILASEPEPSQAQSVVQSQSTAARRILIVDDNRDSALTLAQLLKLAGHDISTAFDGIEAVEVAATFQPDIVLLDLGLPGRNGYDVAREIRKQPWGGPMKLVALTGWGQPDDRRRSSDAGFDAHLVKPTNLAALNEMLAEWQPKSE